MRFDIITLFPETFSYLDASLLKRAQAKKLITVKHWNLREFGLGKRKNTDDRPYGGGPGMVMMVEPISRALRAAEKQGTRSRKTKVILLSPAGKRFTQQKARAYAKLDRLIFICGRYEGVDERVKRLADEELSVGPYVLSGGELAAMIVIDAVARQLPGVLHKEESLEERRTDAAGAMSYPAYTRPERFRAGKGKTWAVPRVLLSGDHKKIKAWREKHSRTIR